MKPLASVCCWKSFQKRKFINNVDGLQSFCNMNLEVLNQLAPEKKKYVRGNQKPLIRKQLSKETINRSILCNRTEDIAAYFFCENLRVL